MSDSSLPEAVAAARAAAASKVTSELLRAALERTGGCIARAAEDLGITRRWAMERVRRFGLNEWARGLREARRTVTSSTLRISNS